MDEYIRDVLIADKYAATASTELFNAYKEYLSMRTHDQQQLDMARQKKFGSRMREAHPTAYTPSKKYQFRVKKVWRITRDNSIPKWTMETADNYLSIPSERRPVPVMRTKVPGKGWGALSTRNIDKQVCHLSFLVIPYYP